jgi:phenylacetate-CoA ligase
MSSPVWVQSALVAAYGWWWYRRRFGVQFRRRVDELREHEHWTRDQFQTYQDTRLGHILSVASRSPYYRRLFMEAGITPSMPPREALARLPLLSKEELRTREKELLTGPPPKGTVTFKSSGTTGTPTEIHYTREFHELEAATLEARNLNWAGATYRDRRVMFGARKICRFQQERPPFWRFSPAENMAYASLYHLSPAFLPAYLEFLRAFRPSVVMGFPSALYAVAEYALQHGDLPERAHAVFTSGERLDGPMRAAIENAWRCQVYDRYGAVEGCVSASQCTHGRYHVNPEVGILEILDVRGRNVGHGIEGEIVCTGLHNELQPLIRYRIGDRARWAVDQSCPCGRMSPILEGIDGRLEDVCYAPDGRPIVRFDPVFKGVGTIRQAQVIQERLDLFSVSIVPAKDFDTQDIDQIKRNMRLHVGDVRVDVRCVPAIALTDGGKFRAVMCRLSPDDKKRVQSQMSVA